MLSTVQDEDQAYKSRQTSETVTLSQALNTTSTRAHHLYQQQPCGTTMTRHYLHQTPSKTTKFRLGHNSVSWMRDNSTEDTCNITSSKGDNQLL
ncbi:hypothetical protein E2C01_011328 [Portunus trituberculatus]|uniref:Uncharacterized protein n=1 Tax=Portunus trituberculatus TaxID=210409 RepID=A0A5B7DB38_PORTR|nr:hypothetical protein [Portunus trituberculatus]